MTEFQPADVQNALEGHQRRRNRGVPTVSVLVGAPICSYNAWMEWNRQVSQPTVTWSTGSPAPLVVTVLKELLSGIDLQYLALEHLSRITGRPIEAIRSRVSNATPYSLGVYWEQLPLTLRDSSLLRWLVDQMMVGEPTRAADADHLSTMLGQNADVPSGLVSLAALVAVGRLPSILIIAHHIEDRVNHQELEQKLVPLTGAIAEALPALPIAVAVEDATLEDYLSHTSESHPKAIFREGLIRIRPRDPQHHISTTGNSLSGSPAQDASVDGAKSHAERFLFAQLESRPQTTGVFRQNAVLDVQFGSRRMEVDLFAASCSVAIEVDGYYHFTDSDSYRRDRRKDIAYQKLGMVILRFLAEDVVRDLEGILETIEGAIAFQRLRSSNTSGTIQ